MASELRRTTPKLGPSDSSDTSADRPGEPSTDTDGGGTGERVTVGRAPRSELHDEREADRVVDAGEAGLGGGLDEAEEAQLGITDEELEARDKARRDAVKRPKR
ncbi:MAG: hypothetical protein JO035_16850 [Betaproteobacteria bacterium]|nr:hypothetical protein [Betaproteobacteria bacterium]